MGAVGLTMLTFAINNHVFTQQFILFVGAKPDLLFWVKIFVSAIVQVVSRLLMAQRDSPYITS